MELITLAALWLLFCFMHSALISIPFINRLKQKTGNYYRFYRLFYNIFSLVTLIPVLLYAASIKQPPFFVWDGYLLAVKYLLFGTGILCFVTGARHYSLGQFSGLAQIREETNHGLMNKNGGLSTNGILGVVRHPFYAGIFPLIWSHDLDITVLITNVILSIYVIIGTLLEERKLIAEFGDAYREYQQRVSMLFPVQYFGRKITSLPRHFPV
ncbi:MAG TPA: isoprenylcysteine carboxylmethyltransferase family protein [Smithellaceae bacterium]|nr:isoprenylcysteine carboxylmethyltransferase family protein [Smithellaceae bacterium]